MEETVAICSKIFSSSTSSVYFSLIGQISNISSEIYFRKFKILGIFVKELIFHWFYKNVITSGTTFAVATSGVVDFPHRNKILGTKVKRIRVIR